MCRIELLHIGNKGEGRPGPIGQLPSVICMLYESYVEFRLKRSKPWSIFSTPAGRGRGPFLLISPMELHAEQLIKAFLLLISLTDEKNKYIS